MAWILKNLWLIPALPMLAAGLSALAPQRCRKFSATLAIGSMFVSLLLSLCAFAHTLRHGGHEAAKEVFNFNWFQFGDQWLQLGWVLDPLTAVMLVMVSFVGLLIFIYSVGYMAHDENFTRFFTFLSLFAGAMLGVVVANSLLLLFICWELVGLTSYLLIGFWYHKPSAAAAAKKAFITTRIGDVALLLGMVWLYSQTNTLLFYDGGNGCLEQSALAKLVAQTTSIGMAVSTGIALLIFAGAVGKSGQIPLHVWLPDAMEGPTPVSALIHAATMVAAGVFLVARVYPLMEATPNQLIAAEVTRLNNPAVVARVEQTLTPALSLSERERENRTPISGKSARGEGSAARLAKSEDGAKSETIGTLEGRTAIPPLPWGEGRGEGERFSKHAQPSPISTALQVITWIGAITAIFAASIAVAQTDIKRILAYSTVSQLGYMMMGLGVGGVAVGMFHLITHAFFKALLFMGAGSIIHGCHDEQDICRMGGLRKFMPVTFATYAIGMLALSGFPLVFSGFWSKDEILHAASLWNVSRWPFYLGLVGALLTAFYMTRQVFYVFFGNCRLALGKTTASEQRTIEHGGVAGGTSSTSSPSSSPNQIRDVVEHVPPTPHESSAWMTIPLVVLAAFAIGLSVIGTPAWPWFDSFLHGEPVSVDWTRFSGVIPLMMGSSIVVFIGLGLGWWLYGRKPVSAEKDPLENLPGDVFTLLRRKYFVDEIYEVSVIRFNAWWSRACDWLDTWVWSGAVQLVSYAVLGLSWLNRFIDEYIVNLGFDEGCRRVTLSGKVMSRFQDGRVQNYLRLIGVALTVLVLILIWGCGK